MAEVSAQDRKKTGFDDGSFPMATGAQIRSAIKLRHHSKSHSAASVLSKASAAVSRLVRVGKIGQDEAKEIRGMIERARRADGSK